MPPLHFTTARNPKLLFSSAVNCSLLNGTTIRTSDFEKFFYRFT